MEVVFSAARISLFPDVIEDGAEGGDLEGIDEDDLKIDRVGCFLVGQGRKRPHLFVSSPLSLNAQGEWQLTKRSLQILMSNGALAIYEAFPSTTAEHPSSRPRSLGVRFVKSVTRRLPLLMPRRTRKGEGEGDVLPPPRREFVPFLDVQGYSGVCVTGEDPLLLIAPDHGPVRIYDYGEKGLYGFSKIVSESAEAGYVAVSRSVSARLFFHFRELFTKAATPSQGSFVASLPENLCYDRELAYDRVPRDRRYSAVAFDIDSGLYAAGALFDTEFMNFDDEGQPVFTPDGECTRHSMTNLTLTPCLDANAVPNLTTPTNYRSALELVMPGSWEAIDGYEFRPNEFISTIKAVSLATKSTATGRKDFIAVGTTVFRAEDLAARGGVGPPFVLPPLRSAF